MDFDSHSSWRFKAPIVRRGLRGKKTSLRAYRDMSNTDIRLHVESTGLEDLGEAVRALLKFQPVSLAVRQAKELTRRCLCKTGDRAEGEADREAALALARGRWSVCLVEAGGALLQTRHNPHTPGADRAPGPRNPQNTEHHRTNASCGRSDLIPSLLSKQLDTRRALSPRLARGRG